MPYITQEARERLRQSNLPLTPGELNYLITCLAVEYCNHKYESYTTFNEIVGALECAKQEFYRRIVAPYENEKRKQNGDVY